MTSRIIRLMAAISGATMLTGCMVGPDYVKPDAPVPATFKEAPAGWQAAAPADDRPKGEWWHLFADPDLDRLETQVTVSNQTLKESEASYREASALTDQARAALWPTLALAGNLTRQSSSAVMASSFSAEATSGWTLDLWGKLRRGIEEQSAAAEASAADLANARLAQQSALAAAWFNLRQTDALHDLLARTVESYRKSLAIAGNQYHAGTTSRSDYISAEAQLLEAQSSLANTDVARAQYEHALAVLIGKPPEALAIPRHPLANALPKAPGAVPSRLIERRPDIAGAERRMQSANAAIGVAIGAYFPDLSISAGYGRSGSLVQPSNPLWSVAGSLSQPLFNAGLTGAEVAAARASYDGTVATYRQTVLTAIQQVDDELSTLRVLSRQAAIEAQTVKAANEAVAIALNEYRAGTQSFTTVSTAEANALADEESALSTRGARYQAMVSLIVALGGGWDGLQASAGNEAAPTNGK